MANRKRKNTPPWLLAMGKQSLPQTLDVDGAAYHLARIFKNDFFAITAMYEGDAGRVLLKVGRTASLFGLPLRWTGRILSGREIACLRVLEGVEGVPRLLGHWGKTGLIREYVDGHAMAKGERVPDAFHDQLARLVGRMHEGGLAYVDLEKCENVLVGDDGRPWLFDFQISWYWPRRFGGELPPLTWIRAWFQSGDHYHLQKLKRRTRPDLMSEAELAASYRKPWYVDAFNSLVRPLKIVRRWLLDRLDPRRKIGGERGRVEEQPEAEHNRATFENPAAKVNDPARRGS